MIVGNINSWMVMFAVDLTNVPADDAIGRSSVVDSYKKSALKLLIGCKQEPMDILEGNNYPDGVWSAPGSCEDEGIVISCNGPEGTPDGIWSTPDAFLEISNDLTPYNGVWSAPNKSLDICSEGDGYHGVWKTPAG